MVRNDSGPGAGPEAGIAPALEHSPQDFERLIEGVRDCAIFMLDPSGLVVSWNPGAERIKGYSAEEIVGRHFSEFYTPEDRSSRPAGSRAAHRRDDRQVRGRGLARAQGRHEVLGQRAHRRPAQGRSADRLCEDHARHDGTQTDAGAAAPVAEDGSDRPADRRRRARFQQSAHRHPRQSRQACAAPARRAAALAALGRSGSRSVGARSEPDAAAARVLATSAAQAEARGDQPVGRSLDRADSPHLAGEHRHPPDRRRGRRQRGSRRQSAGERTAQSGDQREGRDASGRHAHDRNRQHQSSGDGRRDSWS